MERCPACNADLRGRTVCRRCKTDLGLPIRVAEQAVRHLEEARRAFLAGEFTRMEFHAGRACSLRSTPASRRLLAAAALLNRRFAAATRIWRRERP